MRKTISAFFIENFHLAYLLSHPCPFCPIENERGPRSFPNLRKRPQADAVIFDFGIVPQSAKDVCRSCDRLRFFLTPSFPSDDRALSIASHTNTWVACGRLGTIGSTNKSSLRQSAAGSRIGNLVVTRRISKHIAPTSENLTREKMEVVTEEEIRGGGGQRTGSFRSGT